MARSVQEPQQGHVPTLLGADHSDSPDLRVQPLTGATGAGDAKRVLLQGQMKP
jgi:hypothetical protein